MRGDFSRVTFRPENHFSGVLLQQGRVQLDAEFNEHVDIEAYRDRATARDVIGPAGAPLDGGGFAVSVSSRLRGIAAGTDAWAVGEDGTLLRSAGRTAQWTIEDVPAGTRRLNAVAAKDATGWAVGDAGTILRIGGATAKREAVPKDVTGDLYGVHGDTQAAWAVGTAGTVLAWDGTKWDRQAKDADVTATLRAVHFAGNAGVAVGDDGTILATTDAGKKWTRQAAPEGAGDLHGVFLADSKHGWAVGAAGTVLAFDGTTWTAQPPTPRVTATLRGVAFTGAQAGVAVGDGGVALAFANGAWTDDSSGVSGDVLAVTVVPGGELMAAGENATFHSTQPGAGWTAAPEMPAGGRTLALSAGDLYVEGVRCENERTISFSRQPEPPLSTKPFPPPGPATYGVYLQVQEQHLSATEREDLREVALGGPDTATRTRTVWQAGLVRLPDVNGDEPTCADIVALGPTDPPRGRLRARAVPAAVSTSDCIVPPNGGYRRLENQLYRVEIHAGTKATGGATYKWSRDNGSVIARLDGITTNTANKTAVATVSHTGRDATVGFGPDQIVEITDEGRLLRAEPGVLAQIDSIEGRTLVLSQVDSVPLTMADFPVRPIVRRWDGQAGVVPGQWVELEDGVFVEFAEGPDAGDAFRSGDYWTIPARTLTGRVEWPQSDGSPRFEERQGPRRHVAPLAMVDVKGSGVWSLKQDCRKQFPPLTDLVHMYYVGGDGQEGMPPVPLNAGNSVSLDCPLEVGVANGGTPVADAIVEFEVIVGDGRVGPAGGKVTTNGAGIATCEWRLDGATPTQVVAARFRDPLGQSPPQVIRFHAQLSIAGTVAYDGTDCSTLANGKSVDDAIRTLSRLTRIFPLTGSGEDVLPGESIDVRVLVADECGPVDGAEVAFELERGEGTMDQLQSTTQNGVASCVWTPDGQTWRQELRATLTGVPADKVLHTPSSTTFVANVAGYVPPDSCPDMDGATTVQSAITRLAGLLPRLYHVSGDGQEAPVGTAVDLRAGVANRCGIDKPIVRFERLEADRRRRQQWNELGTEEPDDEGIASFSYDTTDQPRQLLRAVLLAEDRVVGYPVYFTVSPQQQGQEDGLAAAARVRVVEGKQAAPTVARTLVEFRQVDFDNGGFFDPGAPTALTARRPGTYLAAGEVQWDQRHNGQGYRSAEIMLRGDSVGHVGYVPLPPGVFTSQQVTAIIRMDAGDRVELGATQSSGAAVVVTGATLSLAWLGP
jgi:photosystem II stability/assembly factor-like uncharacterized protein